MATILPPELTDVTGHAFDEPDRRAVYRAISERRDMREFVPDTTVPADVVARLLNMPDDAEPVAIACLWPVPEFPERPVVDQQEWTFGWPLPELVSENGWHSPARPLAAVVGLPACPR